MPPSIRKYPSKPKGKKWNENDLQKLYPKLCKRFFSCTDHARRLRAWNEMQFIEKNSFNVRSAVYHLKKDDTGLEFLLFPMIHVGSKEFYEEVSRRLAACDLILLEGVNTRKANLLTLSYRVVKKIRRMDLITQREGMIVSGFRDRIINSDMDGRTFDERWASLPLGLRAQLFLYIPFYAVYLFLF